MAAVQTSHLHSSGTAEMLAEMAGFIGDVAPQVQEACLGTIQADMSLVLDALPTVAYQPDRGSGVSGYLQAEWFTWGAAYLARPLDTDPATVGDHGSHQHTMPWLSIFPPLAPGDRVACVRVQPGLRGQPTTPIVQYRVLPVVVGP